MQTKKRNDGLSNAKIQYNNYSKDFTRTLSLTFKVYQSGDYYSYKLREKSYFGDYVPRNYDSVFGYTYLKSSGKKVSALSVIKDRKKLLNNIKKAFYNKYAKNKNNPDYYYSWLGIKNTTLKSYTYFLNNGYIFASYNKGSAIFLTGTVRIKIC